MSNLGVFGWIRESVRKSVLLGFSDAVEQLGAADGEEPLHPQLAAALRESAPKRAVATIDERPADKPRRKRLGRSLEQLRERPAPKPGDAA
jgi:hypothetical protein